MTKLNLYLVRHGQTYFNIYNKLQGWSNSPLTEKGKQNARDAGERLKNIHFAAAFCSDTTRAMETIQTILDLNQADSVKHPVTSPYFREEFYDSYEDAADEGPGRSGRSIEEDASLIPFNELMERLARERRSLNRGPQRRELPQAKDDDF